MPSLPRMPEYDPDRRPVKRTRPRWVVSWEGHTGQTLIPRQRNFLLSVCREIWASGLDPDEAIRAVLFDWTHFVTVVTSKSRHLKYSAAELSSPHLDFFCQSWKLYFCVR